MSSYRGPWDGGPPGAEQDYAPPSTAHAAYGPPPPAAPPLHPAMPATDPWTGVSYSHYGPPPTYDYGSYTASSYNYNYDPSYYQGADGGYYGKYSDNYSMAQSNTFAYPTKQHSKSGTPPSSDKKRSYRSVSRSISPYEKKDKLYARKRDSSYDDVRRSRSKTSNRKHSKYSSNSSNSRSRSSSRSVISKKKQRRSISTGSDRSFKGKKKRKSVSHSLTPPIKRSPYLKSESKRTPSRESSSSKSPISRDGKKLKKSKGMKKSKDKRQRDVSTPPRKQKKRSLSPMKAKKSDRSLITPPRKDKSDDFGTPKSHKYKGLDSETPPRARESSLTPPRSYAIKHASSSSRSRSRTRAHKHSRSLSNTPKSRHSRSHSASSRSSRSSRHSKSRRNRKKSVSKRRSSSKSYSKSHSLSRSRSRSCPKSKSKGKAKSVSSKNKSRSRSNSSHTSSKTSSEEERRGQFTVSDRKKYWRKHRSLQERKETEKTPPREIKPPPGAVLLDEALDINYGDPPEVEGPNFEEILPTADNIVTSAPSTSKNKSIPIPIRNDGSFLEMFKKLQEETKKVEEEKKPDIKKPALPFIGKRRGGRVLKTGMVKKAKAIDEQPADNNPKDAWSLYMQEVKKYRETSCEEERKTRPLVK